MKKAIYYGDFDPFTLFDLEVVKQAVKKYDELIIYVHNNYDIDYAYSEDARIAMIKEAVIELPDCDKISTVSNASYNLVDFTIVDQINYVVRGIRPTTSDLEKETAQATINGNLARVYGHRLTTEYIHITDELLQSISRDSLVHIGTRGNNILLSAMLPQNVLNYIAKKSLNGVIKECFVHYDDQQAAMRILSDAYCERGYHNFQHIGDMMDMLGHYLIITEFKCDRTEHRDLLLAIFWHDVIIEGDDNESAEDKSVKSLLHLASDWSVNINSSIDRDEVVGMIRATKLGVKATTDKEKLIADLDKAVLGTTFVPWWTRYEEGLRMEYPEASDKEYLEGRIKFLGQLQEMDRIYQTDWFYQQFEKQARTNIANAIWRLGAKLKALS